MKKIKMQLFGSFLLMSDTAVLGEEELHSNKLTRLLAYLLIHRDSMLTHRQLIEVFWEDNTRKPEGALKNLMYRIRNELKVLGDEKFICTLPGAYRWNPEIEVETDYEKLERMAMELRLTKDIRKKERICREIISCYKGNVSVKLADESWILPKVTWYQSVYMDAAKRLCTVLEKEEKWDEIELLCSQALNEDSLDEDIHCYLIRSLHGQRKFDLALAQYEKANRLFYENMGIRDPEKLRNVFQKIMSETGEHITDIGSLLNEAREQVDPEGVFFCDYQIFRQIYRMEMRRIDRLGIAEYIILLTIRKNSRIWRRSSVDQGLIEGMDILEKSIRESLRVGDVAARYSPTQVIVLLPTCTYESGVKVAERIRNNFKRNIGNRKIEMIYELAELSAPGI